MTETLDRRIALEGAVNFRDLGGYDAGDGLQTRWRTLFRADGLGELTETDITVLGELGIRTVIDLRSGSELERGRFDVEAHPAAFHHFPFIEELPDAQDFDRRPGLLGTQYLEIVRDAGGQILAALEVLATPDALPAVFHCTAGKDRTGVLSAVLLSLLGVDEPTVVADYALEWRGHAAAAGQAHGEVPRRPGDAREHRRGLLGRPRTDGTATGPRPGDVRVREGLRLGTRCRPRTGREPADRALGAGELRRLPGRRDAGGRPPRPGRGRAV